MEQEESHIMNEMNEPSKAATDTEQEEDVNTSVSSSNSDSETDSSSSSSSDSEEASTPLQATAMVRSYKEELEAPRETPLENVQRANTEARNKEKEGKQDLRTQTYRNIERLQP